MTPREQDADRPEEGDEEERLLAEIEAFAAAFRRSAKGNYWQRVGRYTLTAFRAQHGYKWVLDDGEGGKRWSPDTYRTHRVAMETAWWVARDLFGEPDEEDD